MAYFYSSNGPISTRAPAAYALVLATLCVALGCQGATNAPSEELTEDATVGTPPEMDLTKLDAEVRTSIEGALQTVTQQPRSASSWGGLGMRLLAHDLFAPAAQCFAAASKLNEREPRWPYFHGIALRTSDPEQSIERLQHAVQMYGERQVMPQLRLATAFVELERFDEAQDVLARVLSVEPTNRQALVASAKIYLLKNDAKRAFDNVQLAARESRQPTRTMLLVAAEASRRLGDLDAATRFSDQATKAQDMPWRDPLYQPVLDLRTGLKSKLTRADRLFLRNRVDESISLLKRLVREYPDSEWAHILLARGYIRQRQLALAESTLRDALRLNPNSFQANFRMGVVNQVAGRHEQAVHWFEKTIELQPSSAVAHKNIALCRFLLGDKKGAEKYFRRAVEVQPNYFEGYLALGEFYLKAEKPELARSAFESARSLRPDDPRVLRILKDLK